MRTCGGIFDLAGKERRLAELRALSERPDFWDDHDSAERTVRELSRLEGATASFHQLAKDYEDLKAYLGLLEESRAAENSAEFTEFSRELRKFGRAVHKATSLALLAEENDAASAIVTIHAGAGGTESHDWVDMLTRMYVRWAGAHGFRVRVVERSAGEVAGTKSITLQVRGQYAYGLLRSEHGVHRLVRISPFDASSRRHTTFANVDVIPEIAEVQEVEINDDDLIVDTFRASGAGGQHVNKTSSAVRITHRPTGMVVTCQDERSQHLNREVALRVLASRLMAMLRAQQKEKIEELRGEEKQIAWGNQIRSYVLHPYQLVKDLRTGLETGNTQKVLDGEIDDFIDAFLKSEKQRAEKGKL